MTFNFLFFLDERLAVLCQFYDVEIASYLDRGESFDSTWTEPDVTNAAGVAMYRTEVLQAICAVLGVHYERANEIITRRERDRDE